MKKIFVIWFTMLMIFLSMEGNISVMAAEADSQNGKENEYTYYVMLKKAGGGEMQYYVESESLAYALSALMVGEERFCFVTKILGSDYWDIAVNEKIDFTNQETVNALATLKEQALAMGNTNGEENFLDYGALILLETKEGEFYIAKNTVEMTAAVNEFESKSVAPTIEIKWEGESEESTKDTKYSAEYGKRMEYTIVITLGKGNNNLKMQSKLSTGVTFDKQSFEIFKIVGSDESKIDETCYEVSYSDNLEIEFKNDFLGSLSEETKIKIIGKAYLNKNAEVGKEQTMQTVVFYGPQSSMQKTPTKEVKVRTFGFTLKKLNGAESPLAGVKFTLKNSKGKFYTEFSDAEETSGEEAVVSPRFQEEEKEITTDANGEYKFTGLAAGTYELQETETVAGYKVLTSPIKITIANNGQVTVGDENQEESNTVTAAKGSNEVSSNETSSDENKIYYGTVTVINEADTKIPSTGGRGTGVFYFMGSIMMTAAVVLFVMRGKKKRKEIEG